MKKCTGSTKHVYSGGHTTLNVFEELEMVQIVVPTEERFYPWFAVFDFESILQKITDDHTERSSTGRQARTRVL